MIAKLFSHTDMDGYGCNILLKYVFPVVSYINVNYDEINKVVSEFIDSEDYKNYDITYITDISVNKEVAEKIQKIYEEGYKVILLDHHKNLEWLNEYEWATVYNKENTSETMCGTKLLYKNLVKNTNKLLGGITFDCFIKDYNVKKLVDMIDSYDTWKWKETGDLKPKQLNDLFNLLGSEEFKDNLIEFNLNPEKLLENNEQILRTERYKISKILEKKINEIIIMNFDYKEEGEYYARRYKVGIVFLDEHISEIGNKLCERFSNIDFVAMINISDKTVNLRTIKDDVDVSLIAKLYNGGGHKKAAGFTINKNIDNLIIKNIFKK